MPKSSIKDKVSQVKLTLKKSQNIEHETAKEEIFVTGWTKSSLDMTTKLIHEINEKNSHGIMKISISALDKMWQNTFSGNNPPMLSPPLSLL